MDRRILIVDDEVSIRLSLEEALTKDGYNVVTAESGAEALSLIKADNFDLVITDLKMPGVTGLELLEALRNQNNDTPVIMMTAYGDVSTAVESMRLGAYNFIQKPFKLSEMRTQVLAALRATKTIDFVDQSKTKSPTNTKKQKLNKDNYYMGLLRACPGLVHIADMLEKVGASKAGNDTSILIQGESGSGKEIVARAIHEAGGLDGAPFMEINCAAVPESLLESELMGHEKGSFTDAKSKKEGLFEIAADGTIFLDEIGEMGILLQSRLLRVLESRKFRRVGGKDELNVNARIVAATNRRLEEAIKEGTFRNDLYYRLQVVEVEIPPLRERLDDIEVLMNQFITDLNLKLGTETKPASSELISMLSKYSWPGNVREMKNVLKRIMILEEPSELKTVHFPSYISDGANPRNDQLSTHGTGAGMVSLAEVEKRQILYTLDKTNNNKSKASRVLGISRQTLREKLRQYEEIIQVED
jgi:two-component system, NtrC family, response regulator AtoC